MGSFACLLLLLTVPPLAAQQLMPASNPGDSASSRGDESPFRRLELPTPTRIRTATGAPGPAYWQQRVDYAIRASLDTVAQMVSGEERIKYTNNSPDTLRYLWIQ